MKRRVHGFCSYAVYMEQKMDSTEIFLNRLSSSEEIFSELRQKLDSQISDITSLESFLTNVKNETDCSLYVSDEKTENNTVESVISVFERVAESDSPLKVKIISDEFVNVIDGNDRITDGELHPTVHVWLIRRRDMGIYVLLQKRSHNKDIYPDMWDVSSAGHVRQGQEYGMTAIRETREELGLEIAREKLEFLGFRRNSHTEDNIKDNELTAVFMCREDIDDSMINPNPSEVSETGWAEIDELLTVMNDGDFPCCISAEEFEMIKKAVF